MNRHDELNALRGRNEALQDENVRLQERIRRLEDENQRLRADADGVLVAENARMRDRAGRSAWCLDIGNRAPQQLMALRRDNLFLERLVAALRSRLLAMGVSYDLAGGPAEQDDGDGGS